MRPAQHTIELALLVFGIVMRFLVHGLALTERQFRAVPQLGLFGACGQCGMHAILGFDLGPLDWMDIVKESSHSRCAPACGRRFHPEFT